MSAIDVAVIGSGPAGLSAAWHLLDGGARVTVYEAAERAGGRMRTDLLDGVALDPAVQLLGAHYAETMHLAREAGAQALLLPAPGRDAFWRRGRPHGLTFGSPASMALSSALPGQLKLKLLRRYLPFLSNRRDSLDPCDPARGAAVALDGESIASWGRRELGDEFVELMVYPLLATYANMLPEETSAGYYHALARTGLELRLLGVRGGVGALATALARQLEARGADLRFGVVVERVEVTPSGARIAARDLDRRHDGVVIAVPRDRLDALLDLPAVLMDRLPGAETRPAVTLGLVLDRPLRSDWFSLSFPRHEPPGDVIAAICNLAAKPGGGVPAGRGAVVVLPTPPEATRLARATPSDVLDRLLAAAGRAIPWLPGAVTRARVYTPAGGSTQLPPGALSRLAALDLSALPGRLALAGDYLGAPTVEGAVRSGRRAAERLLGAVG